MAAYNVFLQVTVYCMWRLSAVYAAGHSARHESVANEICDRSQPIAWSSTINLAECLLTHSSDSSILAGPLTGKALLQPLKNSMATAACMYARRRPSAPMRRWRITFRVLPRRWRRWSTCWGFDTASSDRDAPIVMSTMGRPCRCLPSAWKDGTRSDSLPATSWGRSTAPEVMNSLSRTSRRGRFKLQRQRPRTARILQYMCKTVRTAKALQA
mmetsp:Transcript_33786/g.95625  ORF Transcript_33786/g.95625 Transcript_33786/m.95625 type:complete len:213 (+) Transcript_33786:81-719(+)